MHLSNRDAIEKDYITAACTKIKPPGIRVLRELQQTNGVTPAAPSAL